MQPTTKETQPHAAHAAHHHEPGFWRKYIFSTDHKVIGIQYGLTGLVFLMFGFCLMMVMRWQIAYPTKAIPLVGELLQKILGKEMVAQGVMLPDLYNAFGAMHGTIMVFLAIVPIAFAAFGNFVVPLQIGAPDMAFPRINMVSYQCYFLGGVVMFFSFFIPGGAAKSGWTSYSPLATFADMGHHPNGQTFWILGMVLLITSSLLGAVNFIATIIQLRAKGMTWMRLPFFVWAQFVTAFLLLLAFPPLEAAAILQLMDNLTGTSFFLPTGLAAPGSTTPLPISGGGSPLLWQHLFWFLGHPEVYVLILPAMGIVCEIIANNTRKPIWGYKSLVYSVLCIGFLSFIVWAHHMYLTGIGGLTGLPLGFNFTDLHLHDTYYVIAHFHYVVAPGTIFGLFAGIYYWYPKATGRLMNEFWGKVHFWTSLLFMNMIFQPMFAQGMAGLGRRMYDGGATYAGWDDPSLGIVGVPQWVFGMNRHISWAAWLLGVSQIPFIINFFVSLKKGKPVSSDNPWGATTLEWQTPTPPPHGNFDRPIEVHRGPYEYSVPGHDRDFTPQTDVEKR